MNKENVATKFATQILSCCLPPLLPSTSIPALTITHIPAGSSQPRLRRARELKQTHFIRCKSFSQGTPAHHKKRELSSGLPPASLRLASLLCWMPVALTHLLPLQTWDLNPSAYWSAEDNESYCPSLLNGIHHLSEPKHVQVLVTENSFLFHIWSPFWLFLMEVVD